MINCTRQQVVVIAATACLLCSLACDQPGNGKTQEKHTSPTDLLGWQETRWGMSETELVEVLGDRIEHLPKKQYFKYNTTYTNYFVPEYTLVQTAFEVYLQMNDKCGGLSQVLVRHLDEGSTPHRDFECADLKTALSAKYGPETSSFASREPGLDRMETTWVFPTTTVVLSYSWNEGVSTSLAVRYFPTDKLDLKQL